MWKSCEMMEKNMWDNKNSHLYLKVTNDLQMHPAIWHLLVAACCECVWQNEVAANATIMH